MKQGGTLTSFIFIIPLGAADTLISSPCCIPQSELFPQRPWSYHPSCCPDPAVTSSWLWLWMEPRTFFRKRLVSHFLCTPFPGPGESLPESWLSSLKPSPFSAFLSHCPAAFQPVPAGAVCILSHRSPGPGRQGRAWLHNEWWGSCVSGFVEVPLFWPSMLLNDFLFFFVFLTPAWWPAVFVCLFICLPWRWHFWKPHMCISQKDWASARIWPLLPVTASLVESPWMNHFPLRFLAFSVVKWGDHTVDVLDIPFLWLNRHLLQWIKYT